MSLKPQCKLIFILASILCAPVFSRAQNRDPKKEVLSISEKKFKWMISASFDSLASVLDETLVYMHSDGSVETKAEFLGNMKSGSITYTKVSVESSSATLYPNTAIVRGKCILEGTQEREPYAIHILYSEVYIKMNGSWRLVLRQSNRIR